MRGGGGTGERVRWDQMVRERVASITFTLIQAFLPHFVSVSHTHTHTHTHTQSPHCVHMRAGTKFGDATLTDTMMKDGLLDAFHNYHMGITAENVARQHNITRQQQDEFAAASQNKTDAAQKAGFFTNEITSVTIQSRKGELIKYGQGRGESFISVTVFSPEVVWE